MNLTTVPTRLKIQTTDLAIAQTPVLDSMTVGEYKVILAAQAKIERQLKDATALWLKEHQDTDITTRIPMWRSFVYVSEGGFFTGKTTVTEFLHDERAAPMKLNQWTVSKRKLIGLYQG